MTANSFRSRRVTTSVAATIDTSYYLFDAAYERAVVLDDKTVRRRIEPT